MDFKTIVNMRIIELSNEISKIDRTEYINDREKRMKAEWLSDILKTNHEILFILGARVH